MGVAECSDCFIPYNGEIQTLRTVEGLLTEEEVANVYLLTTNAVAQKVDGCQMLVVPNHTSSATMKRIAQHAKSEFTLIYSKQEMLLFGYKALQRMVKVARDLGSGMVYADHYHYRAGELCKAPVID